MTENQSDGYDSFRPLILSHGTTSWTRQLIADATRHDILTKEIGELRSVICLLLRKLGGEVHIPNRDIDAIRDSKSELVLIPDFENRSMTLRVRDENSP